VNRNDEVLAHTMFYFSFNHMEWKRFHFLFWFGWPNNISDSLSNNRTWVDCLSRILVHCPVFRCKTQFVRHQRTVQKYLQIYQKRSLRNCKLGYEVSVMMDINKSTRITPIARPLYCSNTKSCSPTGRSQIDPWILWISFHLKHDSRLSKIDSKSFRALLLRFP